MKSKFERLLNRRDIETLLAAFAPLLGTASLYDTKGQRLGGSLSLPHEEWLSVWHQVSAGKSHIAATRDIAAWPVSLSGELLGILVLVGDVKDAHIRAAEAFVAALEALVAQSDARRAIGQETLERYREINVLYNVGETLGACLDLDKVCKLVLSESMKFINCRRGFVLLVEEASPQAEQLSLAVSVGMDNLAQPAVDAARQLAVDVLRSGKPRIVNDLQPAGLPRFPVVCAPLRFQTDGLGVILLAEKAYGEDFSAADEKLLLTLATQAASSIRNARLFESVKRQRDEIASMKNFMDNIFASIASGVITTNMNDIITSFNRAAESILDLPSYLVIHRPYQQALSFLNQTSLPKLMQDVRDKGRKFIDFEITPHLPHRGPAHLSVSLSRLRGFAEEPLGVTIVVDDVTEKRKLERERQMVRRYLPPELLDALPGDLGELKLRGERQIVTTLFADIRGFTSFSEVHSPETVVQVINRYFDLAARAIRDAHGVIDKYLGDAVMALFNPPLLPRSDHAWDAVQAAWQLKQTIDRFHEKAGPEERLSFGVGICTGEAVVGNVGTLDRMEYTAIGDAVNVAKRLQENADAGQILMSRSTWEKVKNRVQVNALPPIVLKGRRSSTEVFELVRLR